MSDPLATVDDQVDPDVRRFIRAIAEGYSRFPDAGADFAARRRIAAQVRAPWAAGGPAMATTEDLRVGAHAVPIRIYRPSDEEALPVLVYLHGGGWTIFSIDTHDRLMREYAARSGCAVIGVDYSLSPEVRFPHALDEIGEVIAWLGAHGDDDGLDPARFALGGDSAGANLALSSALRLGGGKRPAALLLNYGAFDTKPRASHDRFGGEAYMLTVPEMLDFWANYLGPEGSADPLARPMLADLTGLPPSFLCIPECDILADENHEMAERMRSAGVEVSERVYRGATHSFLEAVAISALADRAIADASAWLKARLRA